MDGDLIKPGDAAPRRNADPQAGEAARAGGDGQRRRATVLAAQPIEHRHQPSLGWDAIEGRIGKLAAIVSA
jgi:hypothetical protein